jgi:F0F1-type ATP synthase membrane subunit b/b'
MPAPQDDHEFRIRVLEKANAAERLAVAEAEIRHIATAINDSAARTDKKMDEYKTATETQLRAIQGDFKQAMENQSKRAHRNTVVLVAVIVPFAVKGIDWLSAYLLNGH